MLINDKIFSKPGIERNFLNFIENIYQEEKKRKNYRYIKLNCKKPEAFPLRSGTDLQCCTGSLSKYNKTKETKAIYVGRKE